MKIREIQNLLATKRVSSVELIQDAFRAIRERERWNSFITLTEEQALAEARQRDGYPVAYKDLFFTKGVRTTAGSLLYRDFVPDEDAEIVRNSAGISVGKTNLHELAFGATSQNPHFGPVLNPLDDTRIPGGSSGGSAAVVAAGFVPLAWGTDTGGSIRIPASYCGVVGFKPTYGRFSTKGVFPLSWSLDHVGPIAGSVDDCALALGFDIQPRKDWDGVRVGVPENFFFERIDEEVARAVNRSIAQMETLGATVRQVRVPDPAEAGAVGRIIQWSEFAAQVGRITDRNLFGDDVWALREQGLLIGAHEYVNAQRLRTIYRQQWASVWREVDVIATPSTPVTAPKRDSTTVEINGAPENVRMASTRLARSVNVTGEPAISLPCGRDKNGMPIGLQLVAKPFADEALLALASGIEAAIS